MRINQVVERVLKNSPRSRNDDKHLLLLVWQQFGLYLDEHQQAQFYKAPSPETVRRMRQKLQERGEYKADEHVARSRRFRSLVVQQNAPSASAKRLDDVLQGQLL